jgi:predicted MFS family arabinose efflux permease
VEVAVLFDRSAPPASPAAVILAASLVLAVAAGSRSSWGLFIGPINSASGFGPAAVSLAVATSALAWGVAQPVCGALVRRIGAPRLLAAGGALVAVLTALIPLAGSGVELVLVMAAAGAAGAAAGSAPLLMGIVAQRVAPESRGFALGTVSAGGSIGQLAAAPLLAATIAAFGWQAAVFGLAASALLVVPLARTFRAGAALAGDAHARDAGPVVALRSAFANRSYWLLTAGFFVCGFHVSFLTTHMPGVIDLCGLPAGLSGAWLAVVGACNVASSLGAGYLMQRMPMKSLLATVYALRALGVVAFIVLPKDEVVLFGFALWMGLTYMATLPPTTGLIAQLFGARNVATLFGVTTLVHQVGSFLGAWLGGVEVELTGGYAIVWWIDAALALGAAAAHLPIREARRPPAAAPVHAPGALAPAASR